MMLVMMAEGRGEGKDDKYLFYLLRVRYCKLFYLIFELFYEVDVIIIVMYKWGNEVLEKKVICLVFRNCIFNYYIFLEIVFDVVFLWFYVNI